MEEQATTDAAMTLARALADADRLRLAGALIDQERGLDDLAQLLDLRRSDLVRHLARLNDAGLVSTHQENGAKRYRFDIDALHTLRREALAAASSAPSIAAEGSDAWERKVLHDFFDGERLKEIPAQQKKRLVVLRWLAERFEPVTRYPESQVNELIQRHYPDFATLRRALVDHDLMQRERGVYWRAAHEADEDEPN